MRRSRQKRQWYSGAIYHVMSRGNYRREIFKDKEDYQVFLTILKHAEEKYHVKIHAYCLMTNHYHMLVETTDKEIWLFMKRQNWLYAAYHNEKYQLTGHLFQGRYKACIVENDSYFLQTSRYIHLNPVKARIVSSPEQYVWSSYRGMIGMEDQILLETERTLAYFKQPRQEAYRKFVENTTMNKFETQIRESMGEDELWLPW